MQKEGERFTFSHQGQTVQVYQKKVGRDIVYALYFQDGRQPLVLTLAKANEGGKFWTSVPEGRQAEAEVFGPLLASYRPKEEKLLKPEEVVTKPLLLFE
nr:hypothetical protein [uncultured Sediminibacterium sp.]